MEITFNGQSKETKSRTVEDLLSEFELTGKKIAVELNQEIISKTNYSATLLSNGDSIEIVQFVGGG